jgi:dTDP-glucose 4,6-dehydratase
MTRNLTAASLEAGVRQFIFISSDMVYGVPKGRPFRETDVPRPIGPYGWSKLESEVVCLAARDRGMRVTVLRPRLIIGPGRLGVLQRLFDCVRTGRSVPMLGDGSNRYQMVAVSDVAAACVRAILQPRDGVFNLGSADPPPVRRLLAELCERAGSRSSIKALPLGLATSALWALHLIRLAPLNPEQFRIAGVDYVLDTSKAHAELGWEPRLSDADMLWSAYETYVQRVAPVGPTAALSRA